MAGPVVPLHQQYSAARWRRAPHQHACANRHTTTKQRNTEEAVNFDNENGDEASFWEQTVINKKSHAAYLLDFCEVSSKQLIQYEGLQSSKR